MIIATAILRTGTVVTGEQKNPSPEGVTIDGVSYSWNDFSAYKDSLSAEREVITFTDRLGIIPRTKAHIVRNAYRYAAAASAVGTTAYFLFS